ncbi:single-stranded DNA-binding protein [Synergistales bacterium]|nr:single-stranded DNA-binding protein [Synergistales bacterium]
MSNGFNKVIIMGNLARDPDVRFTPNKQKVARITVAVGRQWKNKMTGEVQKQTDFVPVVAWSFLADLCERYLRKGRPVLVDGRLQVRDYDDPKTGVHKWVTEVIAEGITLLSGGRRDEADDGASFDAPAAAKPQQPYRAPQPQYQQQNQSPYGGDGRDDVGSLRDEEGFEEDFPLDFMTMDGQPGEGGGDADVPF